MISKSQCDLLIYSYTIVTSKGCIDEYHIIIPRKKPCNDELIAENKDCNQSISNTKPFIVNIKQRLKNYTILESIYIGPSDYLEKITIIGHLIAPLCNLNLSRHPICNL